MSYDPDEYNEEAEHFERQERECIYGFEFCIDPSCRDYHNCLGCHVIAPPKAEAEG